MRQMDAASGVYRADALLALTDDTGLIQHSKYSLPDPQHGYSADDNARALLLAAELYARRCSRCCGRHCHRRGGCTSSRHRRTRCSARQRSRSRVPDAARRPVRRSVASPRATRCVRRRSPASCASSRSSCSPPGRRSATVTGSGSSRSSPTATRSFPGHSCSRAACRKRSEG